MEHSEATESSWIENPADSKSAHVINTTEEIENIRPSDESKQMIDGSVVCEATQSNINGEVTSILREIRDLNKRQLESLEKHRLQIDETYEPEPIDKDLIQFNSQQNGVRVVSTFTDNLTDEDKHYFALAIWLKFNDINILKLEDESGERLLGPHAERIRDIFNRVDIGNFLDIRLCYESQSIPKSQIYLWLRTSKARGQQLRELPVLRMVWRLEESRNLLVRGMIRAWKNDFNCGHLSHEVWMTRNNETIQLNDKSHLKISYLNIRTHVPKESHRPILALNLVSRIISELSQTANGPIFIFYGAILYMLVTFIHADFKDCGVRVGDSVVSSVGFAVPTTFKLLDATHSIAKLLNGSYQYHVRTLHISLPLNSSICGGIALQRIHARLKTMRKTNTGWSDLSLSESRIACHLVTTINLEQPIYRLVLLSDRPPAYRGDPAMAKQPILFCPFFTGISAFQALLYRSIDWQEELWTSLFNAVDTAVNVKVISIRRLPPNLTCRY
ncbi:hypothetical protein HYFRA_00000345 [Hymenoscyphus fraxineus]|uniref:Uncharacterized protein n=1 Tax=Hymenoscyphus fraxineus TaxID=746836 RepID=A0A9N9L6Q3_9HELO|nr:hypothetical protein HYFRA_00000345 [Hymenoscyphus fraxineus]